MEFRSIADLEQLETLPDDAQILVVDNNTAKRISKANAKFDGGSVTVFKVVEESLQREDGSAVTAQEVYDALMSGPVWVITDDGTLMVMGFMWLDSNGATTDPTDVGVIMIVAGEQQITIGDKSLISK